MTTDTVPPPGPPPIIDCAVCGKRISRDDMKDQMHFVGAGMGISLLGGSEKDLEYFKEQLGPYSIDRTEYLICAECFLRALGVPEPATEAPGKGEGNGG